VGYVIVESEVKISLTVAAV